MQGSSDYLCVSKTYRLTFCGAVCFEYVTSGVWCLVAHLAEAVVAIDRADSSGPEWHFGLGSAVCADGRIHFSGSGANPTSLFFAAGAAILAPARFVGKSSARVELLLTRTENEVVTAICTYYFLVSVHHVGPSSSDTMLRADLPLVAKKRYHRRSGFVSRDCNLGKYTRGNQLCKCRMSP